MTKQPVLVGVTGGIGSGKSTVCSILEALGCELFEADRIAKELQLHDTEIISGIKLLFGKDVYCSDAQGGLLLDRKRIANAVFSDPAMLNKLNRLIHPKVQEAFRQAVEAAVEKGCRVMVKEAAILFESGKDKDLDRIIVVAAGNEVRIRRAVSKGIGSREEVIRRMQAQWPQEKLIERADYVIFNDGSAEELRSQVEQVYRSILEFCSSNSD
jgi:dephospho-CoA kinase